MKKNILIGVTGGIAAYKVVEVASRLKKSGANVRVMMTLAATEFISPRTFRSRPVSKPSDSSIATIDSHGG